MSLDTHRSRCRASLRNGIGLGLWLLMSLVLAPPEAMPAEVTTTPATEAHAPGLAPGLMLALAVGDAVSVQVYRRPELTTTTYVADDGAIRVPLAGRVPVAGMSPAAAAERIAAAFRSAKFLVDPQVTVLLLQSRSQQVSMLGAVQRSGR